jgi:hypothetical protein
LLIFGSSWEAVQDRTERRNTAGPRLSIFIRCRRKPASENEAKAPCINKYRALVRRLERGACQCAGFLGLWLMIPPA